MINRAVVDSIQGKLYVNRSGNGVIQGPIVEAESMCALPLSESILKYMIPWLDLDWPLNPAEIYGQEGAFILEIGFGNGGFLVEQAQKQPDALFLGIERSWGAAQRLFRRLEQTGLGNVRVIQGGAEFLLQYAFEPASIDRIYINFSDPWPKERHHGRRLIQPEFVKLLGERLVAGGEVTIATDHAEYAEYIGQVLEGQSALVSCFDRTKVVELPGRTPTKYELKAIDAGLPINYFLWRREAYVSLPVNVQRVEEMPNVILRGACDKDTMFADQQPQSWVLTHAGVNVVIKLSRVYRDFYGDWLLEMMVKEDAFSQHFGVLVLNRVDGGYLVKLASMGHPRPTWGVKQSVGKVASLIQARFPAMRVEKSTVGD